MIKWNLQITVYDQIHTRVQDINKYILRYIPVYSTYFPILPLSTRSFKVNFMYSTLWSFSHSSEFWSSAFIMASALCNFCIKWWKKRISTYSKKHAWTFLLIASLSTGYSEYYLRAEWNVSWTSTILRHLKKAFKKQKKFSSNDWPSNLGSGWHEWQSKDVVVWHFSPLAAPKELGSPMFCKLFRK